MEEGQLMVWPDKKKEEKKHGIYSIIHFKAFISKLFPNIFLSDSDRFFQHQNSAARHDQHQHPQQQHNQSQLDLE